MHHDVLALVAQEKRQRLLERAHARRSGRAQQRTGFGQSGRQPVSARWSRTPPTELHGAVVAKLQSVTKRYGTVVAVDGVDLEVPSGQILGLLGPNGAGKTTVVSLLAGLRRPDGGSVQLLGSDPRDPEARAQLGIAAQDTGMPEALTVTELVDWTAAHFAAPRDRDALLEDFGLTELASRRFGGLSGGQKRMVAVALAFAGDPTVVALDEPTTGLDVTARRSLWDAVRRAARAGTTIVLTSHYLEEVEALADRVVVFNRGRVIADGTVEHIRGVVGLGRVTARVPQRIRLDGFGNAHCARRGDRVEWLVDDPDDLVRGLVNERIAFSDLQVRPATLEEAFLTLTADRRGHEVRA